MYLNTKPGLGSAAALPTLYAPFSILYPRGFILTARQSTRSRLALLARGYAWEAARQEARQMLDRLGLSSGTEPGRLRHRPAELSRGEQQRVALARAVVGQPSLLLADEPTGNLDSENAAEIIRLLASLRQDLNLTCVLATHNPEFRQVATQVIELRDGLARAAGTPSP